MTPPFPSYVSGHSSTSGAASTVLVAFFPADATRLRAMAEEAAVSRLYGGIHYRSDNEAGLTLVARAGGSISAEHGIGVAKRRWLTLARSPEEIDARFFAVSQQPATEARTTSPAS